jgi:hypothetical protein
MPKGRMWKFMTGTKFLPSAFSIFGHFYPPSFYNIEMVATRLHYNIILISTIL